MQTLLDVVNVQTQSDYMLLLHCENGEHHRFDMQPYIHQKPWTTLSHIKIFNQARIDNGTVVWPEEIDVDPDALYERSEPA